MVASSGQDAAKAAGDKEGPSFQPSRGVETLWQNIQQRKTASLLRREANARSHRRSRGPCPEHGTRDLFTLGDTSVPLMQYFHRITETPLIPSNKQR